MRINFQEQGARLSNSWLLGLKATMLLEYLVHLEYSLIYLHWYKVN